MIMLKKRSKREDNEPKSAMIKHEKNAAIGLSPML
jgi:hypothetical protein